MFNNNFDKGYGFCQKDNQCCPTICEQKCPEDPVYEAPMVNCVQKDFIHEVVHVCPIHTKVVNNHIYKHTYVPEYTCSEEDVCTSINDNCQYNKF